MAAKYKFTLSEIRTPPPQFLGCVTNFVFPSNYHYLETFPDIPCVLMTIGIHPTFSGLFHQWNNYVENRASFPDIVAVGETGLDAMHASKHHNPVPMRQQLINFELPI